MRRLPLHRRIALKLLLNASWPPRAERWLMRVICPPFKPRRRR